MTTATAIEERLDKQEKRLKSFERLMADPVAVTAHLLSLLRDRQRTDAAYVIPITLAGIICELVAGAEDAAKAKRSV